MKRVLLALLLAGLLAVTALGSASTARAMTGGPNVICGPGGCGGGGGGTLCNEVPDPNTAGWYRTYAGYSKNAVPGLGSNINGQVRLNSGTVYNGGFVAGWLGVAHFNASGVLDRWVQGGVLTYHYSGPYLYLEYNTNGLSSGEHILLEGAASFGMNYGVTITQEASLPGYWDANVAGHQITVNLGSMSTSQFTSESFDTDSTNCNALDVTFSSVNPWGTGSMSASQYGPSFLENIGTNTWESVQVHY
jgi:hypothetical protein